MKHMNINIEDAQQIPSKINSKTHTNTHYYQIFKRQRENMKSSEMREKLIITYKGFSGS